MGALGTAIVNARISKKVGVTSGLMVVGVLSIGIVSYWGLSSIGEKVVRLVEEDIPLQVQLAEIGVASGERSVYFERAARYGIIASLSSENKGDHDNFKDSFLKNIELFNNKSSDIGGRVEEVKKFSAMYAKTASGEHKDRLDEFVKHADDILHERLKYQKMALNVFNLLKEEKVKEAEDALPEMEAEASLLDKKIVTLLHKVEESVEKDGKAAEAVERTVLIKTLVTVLIVLGLAIGMISLFRRTIVLPISESVEALRKLAGGDVGIAIKNTERKDEVGDIWKTLEVLVETVDKAFQHSNMLDKMPINVMVADPNTRELVYMNEASARTLKTLEHLLPIKVEDMLGTSIDVFHKNPKVQADILKDPSRLPYKARIEIGSDILSLDVNPVNNKLGEYSAAMATWSVVTAEETLSRNVVSTMGEVSQGAEKLTSSVDEMKGMITQADQLTGEASGSAEQATMNVQTLAAATEEMTASIQEISRQVNMSTQKTSEAVSKAETTKRGIQDLAESSQEIGGIIGLISDIAEQINLLALNATIESARAGEAGKGFAVVASEVKSLAGETTRAIEKISTQIGSVQGTIDISVNNIEDIVSTVDALSEVAESIAAAIEQQNATTSEINHNIQDVAQGMKHVSENMTNISDVMKKNASSANDVASVAGSLSGEAAKLEDLVNQQKS